jgi:hypothetical protein
VAQRFQRCDFETMFQEPGFSPCGAVAVTSSVMREAPIHPNPVAFQHQAVILNAAAVQLTVVILNVAAFQAK